MFSAEISLSDFGAIESISFDDISSSFKVLSVYGIDHGGLSDTQ
jgi:hypothetical protein